MSDTVTLPANVEGESSARVKIPNTTNEQNVFNKDASGRNVAKNSALRKKEEAEKQKKLLLTPEEQVALQKAQESYKRILDRELKEKIEEIGIPAGEYMLEREEEKEEQVQKNRQSLQKQLIHQWKDAVEGGNVLFEYYDETDVEHIGKDAIHVEKNERGQCVIFLS